MRACSAGLFRRAGYAVVLATTLFAFSFASAQDKPVNLSETGSTLLYPLFNTWAAAYEKAVPSVHITSGATGSGAGIAQAVAGKVILGASDAYMSDNEAMAHPNILNIPLAISAQTVDVNLPGLRNGVLNLSGPVLAGIYSGNIHDWDAAPIAALNPGVHLPHHAIVPVRRIDASGDTFIFTQYLTFTTSTADGGTSSWGDTIGYGTSVKWPSLPRMVTARGNDGMVRTIGYTPYSLGYVGVSYESQASGSRLIVARLENQDGKFLLPTPSTIIAAAAALTPRTPPDERLTLVFAPGADSYPLINYEYVMVSQHQANPQVASALQNFLLWCISPVDGSSSSMLQAVHFLALPTAIRARSEIQIAKIH